MKKTLVAAGLASAAALLLSAAPASAAGVDPQLNHTSYWEAYLGDGSTCVKTEYTDGTKMFVAPDDAVLVVIKAGTQVTPYEGSDLYYPIYSDKDISFVIVCTGDGGPIS